MNGLEDLYGEMLIEHSRSPKNRGELPVPPARNAEGNNPLCGDRVEVFVEFDGDRIKRVAFRGEGCAISTAAASVMSEVVQGLTRSDALALFERFHTMLTAPEAEQPSEPIEPETLRMFEGVSKYPMRVKCATLAWHALHAALEDKPGTVTTE